VAKHNPKNKFRSFYSIDQRLLRKKHAEITIEVAHVESEDGQAPLRARGIAPGHADYIRT